MNEANFQNEKLYEICLSIAKTMQKQGLISEADFLQTATILQTKYQPIIGSLFST